MWAFCDICVSGVRLRPILKNIDHNNMCYNEIAQNIDIIIDSMFTTYIFQRQLMAITLIIAIQPFKWSSIDCDVFNKQCQMVQDISSCAHLQWAGTTCIWICDIYVLSSVMKVKMPQTILYHETYYL